MDVLLSQLSGEFSARLSSTYDQREIQGIFLLAAGHTLGISRAALLSERQTTTSKAGDLLAVLERLEQGEPIQYILGETEFYGLQFEVNSGTLIPRQETEELVHLVLNDYRACPRLRVVDIGTGSGCIAVALAKNLHQADVTGIDISARALETARRNAARNNVSLQFVEDDILVPPGCGNLKDVDIVVSNPPYVLEKEKELMHENVLSFEPHLALFVPDNDPLKFYKAIAMQSMAWLKPGGRLYLEINETQGPATAAKLKRVGYTGIELIRDLSGKDRFVKAAKD